MSGVSIVRTLLAGNAALLAVVPAARIQAGVLPLNTVLPAISIKEVDAQQRLDVQMVGTKRFVTERVQVTVLAKTYPLKKSILELVRKALPLSRGTVGSFACDSVLPEGTGPDLDDPETQIFEQSRDYVVRWNES